MEDIKKLLRYFRNALAFSYSWLVLCTVLASLLGGAGNINTMLLPKGLILFSSYCVLLFDFPTVFAITGRKVLHYSVFGVIEGAVMVE